jgi:hypothetical protein
MRFRTAMHAAWAAKQFNFRLGPGSHPVTRRPGESATYDRATKDAL